MGFSPYLGIGRARGGGGGCGLPKDWYTTGLYHFSPWAAQKAEFPKVIFFDIVMTSK